MSLNFKLKKSVVGLNAKKYGNAGSKINFDYKGDDSVTVNNSEEITSVSESNAFKSTSLSSTPYEELSKADILSGSGSNEGVQKVETGGGTTKTAEQTVTIGNLTLTESELSVKQESIINSATSGVGRVEKGMCLRWVNDVLENAGVTTERLGSAKEAYYKYCDKDMSELEPGMIVATPSTNDGNYVSGGAKYGHIGIYIGNDTILNSSGGVLRYDTVQGFMDTFGYGSSEPYKCGWYITQ